MCVIISNAYIRAINAPAANVRYSVLLIHAARRLAHFSVDTTASRINMHIKFVLICLAVYEPQHVCLSWTMNHQTTPIHTAKDICINIKHHWALWSHTAVQILLWLENTNIFVLLFYFGGVAFYSVVSDNTKSQKLQILWDSLLSVIQIFSITNGHQGVFQISPMRDADQQVSVLPGWGPQWTQLSTWWERKPIWVAALVGLDWQSLLYKLICCISRFEVYTSFLLLSPLFFQNAWVLAFWTRGVQL